MTDQELAGSDALCHIEDPNYVLLVIAHCTEDTLIQTPDGVRYQIRNSLLWRWYQPAEVETFL